MDFNEFFSPMTIVEHVFNEKTVRHHFREIDSETDLEYQRKMARAVRTAATNGKVDLPDNVLNAEIWLYDRLCEKVEVQNEVGFEVVPDFKKMIPVAMKRRAALDYNRRIQDAEKTEAEEKN